MKGKEIIKIRQERNEMETKKQYKKSMKLRPGYFRRQTKLILLPRLIKKKKSGGDSHKIRNERSYN